MSFFAAKAIKQPMGNVIAFLIFVNIVTILIITGPNFQAQAPIWPVSFKISEPDITDIRTMAIITLVAAIFVIWIVANQLAAHIHSTKGQLEERLDLLYDAPEISKMLVANERRLLDHVVNMWIEFINNSGNLGDFIRYCVPVGFNGYILKIGCLTDKEVRDITNPIPIGTTKQLPPRQFALEKMMQNYFGIARLKISAEKIDQDEYSRIRRLIEQANLSSFHRIPLDQIANANLEADYYDPPFGEREFINVPFTIKKGGKGIFNTSQLNANNVTLFLDEPIRGVVAAHILINAGNTSKHHIGKKIGEIRFDFGGDDYQTEGFILGKNIREWAPGNSASGDLVDTVSDNLSQLVWEGKNQAGNRAIIDCLQISISKQYQDKLLQQIVISKSSTVPNSAFLISAITLRRN
jgi:hypothetical protein